MVMSPLLPYSMVRIKQLTPQSVLLIPCAESYKAYRRQGLFDLPEFPQCVTQDLEGLNAQQTLAE